MRYATFILFVIVTLFAASAQCQLLDDNNKNSVRVTVSINADGSRTTYEFNNERHQATATTTSAKGEQMGMAIYQIDDAGRFVSGVFLGPDKKFRFKSLYKYGDSGRLEQETHLAKDDSVLNRMIYHYDPAGKMIGYSVFDASGKLIGNTTSSASKSKSRNKSGH